jgi:hypothetical protein
MYVGRSPSCPQHENGRNGCGSALTGPAIVATGQPRAKSWLPDDEAAHPPLGLTSSNLLGGEEESITMSYIPCILTFLLVLSPLFIPVGVTVVHAIRTWRPRLPVLAPAAAPQPQRLELATEFD